MDVFNKHIPIFTGSSFVNDNIQAKTTYYERIDSLNKGNNEIIEKLITTLNERISSEFPENYKKPMFNDPLGDKLSEALQKLAISKDYEINKLEFLALKHYLQVSNMLQQNLENKQMNDVSNNVMNYLNDTYTLNDDFNTKISTIQKLFLIWFSSSIDEYGHSIALKTSLDVKAREKKLTELLRPSGRSSSETYNEASKNNS